MNEMSMDVKSMYGNGVSKICMIGADNPHYVHSLVLALVNTGIEVDLIADDVLASYQYHHRVKVLNLRGSTDPNVSIIAKVRRILKYYFGCLLHNAKSEVRIVHIQAYRFPIIDGLMVLLYRILGKKVVYTAHGEPKENNKLLNHFQFFLIYRAVSHIICHSEKLRSEFTNKYKLDVPSVSVIPHGVNQSVMMTQLSQSEARERLGLKPNVKVLLSFGNIIPYKGTDIALKALKYLPEFEDVVLLIAGPLFKDGQQYLQGLKEYVKDQHLDSKVKFFSGYIPDADVEIFFKAADVILLPYNQGGFQSGVLFLSYAFGVPAIVSDVGSVSDEIEEGVNGYVFNSGDPQALAAKICEFYKELFLQPELRKSIRQLASERYNWIDIAEKTMDVYRMLN